MITEKEFAISNDSYTKKDFYQIYPEILDLVTKITARWNPDSSNESDPGIVLLKVLSFIGDKLNYNIDKNVLECFMPSATQEQSMRKLCEMMGYEMKYYGSGTTTITFQYEGEELQSGDSFSLPAFDTVVTDTAGEVNYVLTQGITITTLSKSATATAIEGTLCQAVAADSDVIILNDLDDNNRFYLPEEMIAQNGIWIRNVQTPTIAWESSPWHRVTNLNTQGLTGDEQYCYKFGYDSKKNLPYIEFPNNISEIIGQGLNIQYVRTTGANGNVAAKVLTKIADTTSVTSAGGTEIPLVEDDETQLLLLANYSASTNGVDKETLNSAYNNFKRTIGTFDTLVTCRDYANKIYQLVYSDTDTRNLVSNVQVSDIRDDWRSNTVATFDDYGIAYKTVPYEASIGHSDLVMRTMTPVDTFNWASYYNSFKPYFANEGLIEAQLEDYKLASHNYLLPTNELFAIKMYADVTAKITTTKKVNAVEEKIILANVKNALYKNFNSRQVDFGEAIPYDSIYETILNADSRIKNVALDEPTLTPYTMDCTGTEKGLFDTNQGGNQYKLPVLAKNVVAGRVPLLKYDEDFDGSFDQKKITAYELIYGESPAIGKIVTNLEIAQAALPYSPVENESIQMIAPSFKTDITYPAYINYHFTKATTANPVAANSEYKLVQGDSLKINYTDSTTSNVMNIEYTHNAIITNGTSVAVPFNIIRPNFDLYDSATYKSSHPTTPWAKTSGFLPAWSISGMFALGTNEQIEHRDYVKTVINKVLKCYWMTKDGYLFHTNVTERILGENEYFFYTNDSENILITLGSGTKLIRLDSYPESTYYIDPNAVELSEEEIAQKGLGAFTSTAWKSINYTTSNLTIQEMQIINLGVDSSLSSLTFATGGSYPIDNEWQSITTATYTIDGSQQTLPTLPSTDKWQIRTRLDLNIGKDTMQTIAYAANKTSTVTLYQPNGASIVALSPASTYNLSLKCNYTIQEAGNEFYINTTSLAESNLPNLKINVFDYKKVIDHASNEVTISDYTKVDFSTTQSVTFNVALPANRKAIMMFYYAAPQTPGTGDPAKLTCNGNNLHWYNDSTAASSSLILRSGINVVVIDASETVVLQREASSPYGAVIFDKVRFIYSANDGVDLDKFGLTAGDVSWFLALIKNYARGSTSTGTDIFYYNIKPDNSVLIDEETMLDPNVWYDYNNICNKFVITELDTGKHNDSESIATAFPNITLTKASRA